MLRPVEISIIPNAGAIFLVPELVMKLFIDNAEDFDDGVYNFIQFVEDKLEPFFSKIGVHYIDELFVEYQLIENDTYEITALREDSRNLDAVEAGFESSKFNFEAGIFNATKSNDSIPTLYRMVESVLINIGYEGTLNILMLPNDTFVHFVDNDSRIDFVLSEFCSVVNLQDGISLDVIYSASSLIETIKIDSKGGRYQCQNIWVKKDFTKRQRARLKKALRMMKGSIEEKK